MMRARKTWAINGKSHRITISLDQGIHEKIQNLQGILEKEFGTGWSLAKTINLLILGGILAQNQLTNTDWSSIRNLSEGRGIDLGKVSMYGYYENLFLMIKTDW